MFYIHLHIFTHHTTYNEMLINYQEISESYKGIFHLDASKVFYPMF